MTHPLNRVREMDALRRILTGLRALIYMAHTHRTSQDVTGQVQARCNNLDTVGISGLSIAKRKASATVQGCFEKGSDFSMAIYKSIFADSATRFGLTVGKSLWYAPSKFKNS